MIFYNILKKLEVPQRKRHAEKLHRRLNFTKGLGVCCDVCKNTAENYRMERGVLTHKEGDLELVGKWVSEGKVELRAY